MQKRITIVYDNNSTDILVDEEQRIKTTLKILQEERSELFHNIYDASDIRLSKTGRRINKDKTYTEENIYSGDIIIVRLRG